MLRKCFLLPLFLLPFATACGDDDPAGPSVDDVTGTWTATSLQLVSVANSNTRVDLITFGYTCTLILEQDGDFFITVVDPELGNIGGSGNWSSTDVLTMEFLEGQFDVTWEFDITLTGNTLRLTGADAEYDFDDDGTEDAAKLNLTLVRD
jgi:hypothetical protein